VLELSIFRYHTCMDGEVIHWPGHHIEFRVSEPADGAISAERAVEILRAMRNPQYELSITAMRFGVIDARYPAIGRGGGESEPLYWNRPVWIVTETKVGLHSGRGPRSEPWYGARDTHTVFDGFTGEYLFAFS
jgi:hypothetical protein